MDGKAAILVFDAGDVVGRVSIVIVLYKESLAVVEADGPKPVHRHVLYGKCVWRLAVIFLRYDVEVGGILCRVSAPAVSRAQQMCDGVHFLLTAETLARVFQRRGQYVDGVAQVILGLLVPVGNLELADRIHHRGIFILVNHLHGLKAIIRIGFGDCYRTGQIEYCERIQSVPVHPHHFLLINGSRLQDMKEFAETTQVNVALEILVGLGSDKGVPGNGYGVRSTCRSNSSVEMGLLGGAVTTNCIATITANTVTILRFFNFFTSLHFIYGYRFNCEFLLTL